MNLHRYNYLTVTIAGSYLYNEMVTHRSSVLHNGNTKGSRYTQQTNCHSYGIVSHDSMRPFNLAPI